MTEAIYKVGDILEIKNSQCFPAYMDSIPVPIRALIIRVDESDIEHTAYELLVYNKECGSFIDHHICVLQKDLIVMAKRIEHFDISALRFEKQDDLSPALISAFAGGWCLAMMNQKNEEYADSERFHKLMDILNRVDELQDQTEKIRNLEEENDKLKKENEKLKVDNEKLADDIGKYLQNVTCVEKELTEAAQRIYFAREHLNRDSATEI